MRPGTAKATLDDLQFHWSRTYLITGAARHWIAHRRDSGRMIVADSPAALDAALTADDAQQPVLLASVLGGVV